MGTITLVLPDELRTTLANIAEQAGLPLEDWLLDQIRSRFPQAIRIEPEREDAMARLMRHAGAVDLGFPTGADNDAIDADLAREYANAREDG